MQAGRRWSCVRGFRLCSEKGRQLTTENMKCPTVLHSASFFLDPWHKEAAPASTAALERGSWWTCSARGLQACAISGPVPADCGRKGSSGHLEDYKPTVWPFFDVHSLRLKRRQGTKKWSGVHHPAFPLPKIQAPGDCFLQHLWWSARFIHPLAPLHLRRPRRGEKRWRQDVSVEQELNWFLYVTEMVWK